MISLLDQTKRELLRFEMNRETRPGPLSILSESFTIAVQFLLIGCAHVTEPFAVRVDLALLRISRRLLHLLHVRLRPIHVEPINGSTSPELRARLASRRVRSVRIRARLASREG